MAYVISDDCIACGTCLPECPVEAISEGDIYKIDADACTECGTCASVCPSEAISLPQGTNNLTKRPVNKVWMDKRLAHFGAIAQPSTSEPCSLTSFFMPFRKLVNKRVAVMFNPTT